VIKINRAFGVGRDAKAFLNMQGGLTRGAVPNPKHHEEQAKRLRKIVSRQRKALQRKDRQIEDQAAALEPLRERRQREIRLRKELKQKSLEIFHLKNELDAMKVLVENARDVPLAEQLSGDIGALPDFVIIGAQKGGTSFLYYLLTRHDPPVAERMAKIVPKTQLIALLRNPIDRAYSHYQMQVKRGTEPRSFEEAIEQPHSSYVSRGIYVDQLLRWFEFFSKEQMLILKSEDFFERPVETLKVVLTFLDLPDWQPEASELQQRRHTGTYSQKMDPATRRRLEAYFEPYNQRLYEYLDVDFGW
jgi:hypothetical protein